ncbi:hypothetical protein CSUI_010596 [Cystoisospora suis]|uniref:Transmembrane protein n=1 Tax=Cystoisospora suis TaxID=483139 RepID=A0A2C6KEM6_9APIC|nr:hypothetical protein CSUI_010596 [Cystoisospora suis]
MLRTCRTSFPLSSHCELTVASLSPPRPSLSFSSLNRKSCSQTFHCPCCRVSLCHPPPFPSKRFRFPSHSSSVHLFLVSARSLFFSCISFFLLFLLFFFTFSSSIPPVLSATAFPVSSSSVSPTGVSLMSDGDVERAVEGVGLSSRDHEEGKLLLPRNEERQEIAREEEKEKARHFDRPSMNTHVDRHAPENRPDMKSSGVSPEIKNIDGDRSSSIIVGDSGRTLSNSKEEETRGILTKEPMYENPPSQTDHGKSRSLPHERHASKKNLTSSRDPLFQEKEEEENGLTPFSFLAEEEEDSHLQEAPSRKEGGGPKISRPSSNLLLRFRKGGAASLRRAQSPSPSFQSLQDAAREEEDEEGGEEQQEEEGSRDMSESSSSSETHGDRSFNLYEESASQVFEGGSAMRRRMNEEEEEARARRRRRRSSVYLYWRGDKGLSSTWTTSRDQRAFRHFKLKLLGIALVAFLYILWRPDARLERRILSRQIFPQRLRHLLGYRRRSTEPPVSRLSKLLIFSPVFSITLSLLISSLLVYYSSHPASRAPTRKIILQKRHIPL